MRDREGWKQVTACGCKRNPSLPSQLPLQNRYDALGMVDEGHDEIEEEESVQVLSPRSDKPNSRIKSCIKTNTDKKQWQIMVSSMSVSPQGWMGFIPEY